MTDEEDADTESTASNSAVIALFIGGLVAYALAIGIAMAVAAAL